MTVAAVIVPRDRVEALADAAGRAAVRRIVDIAWAGGALPIIVVVDDPDGSVAAAIAGSPARIVPGAGAADGSYRIGADEATTAVVGTNAWLLWPGDHAWVDPETVTSLIEAHGAARDAILRPAWHGEPGWPVLVPVAHLDRLRAVAPDRMPPDVVTDLVDGAPSRVVELGDPGVVHDVETPLDDLPSYEGPPDPPAGE